MNDLALINGKKAFTTTLIISEGVVKEHRAVMQLVDKHKDDILTLGTSAFRMRKLKSKGKPTRYYEMNEMQATFLISLMQNSKIVVKFKLALVKAFKKQQDLIAQLLAQNSGGNYTEVRQGGIAVYHQKTDVIKDFIDYAIGQGGSVKGCGLYYSNLAKMENKHLFILEQKFKNVREMLNTKQLMQIATADQIIEKALQEGMEQEMNYKDIFILAKDRVINFAEIMGQSPVVELLAIKGNQ